MFELQDALRRKEAEVQQLVAAAASQTSEIENLRRQSAQRDEEVGNARAALERDRSAFEAELTQLDRVAERERQVTLLEERLAGKELDLVAREKQVGDLGALRDVLQKQAAEKDAAVAVAQENARHLAAKCVRLERAQIDLAQALAAAKHLHERASVAERGARAEAAKLQTETADLRRKLTSIETQAARDAMALRALQAANERLRAEATSQSQLWTSNEHLLGWLLQNASRQSIGARGRALGWCGSGPFADDVLDLALRRLGFDLYELAHESLSHVVVGRSAWSEEHLLQQIDLRQGKTLRVYSQEMLVAALLTGSDPLDSQDDALLQSFKLGHPALEFLAGEAFRWPAVTVPDTSSVTPLAVGDLGVVESPLHVLGYKVGVTSPLDLRGRRDVLRDAFERRELPFVESNSYMSRWGTKRSHQRLWRIATHLAHMLNGPVGRDYRKPQARRDWIEDLRWLKREFYDRRRFKFTWPDVEVASD